MKLLLLSFLMFLISFPLFAVNEINYVEKIEGAKTAEEREKYYLDWVTFLSQSNTLKCDSVISERQNYISKLSDDGKIALIILHFNNSRLGGVGITPDVSKYQLNKADMVLVNALVKCHQNIPITKKEYAQIKLNYKAYADPTRRSLFYVISTCLENIDQLTKLNYYENSIEYAKLSPIKTVASSIYDILSLVYIDLEDFEKAFENQQNGISFSKTNKLQGNTLNHLVNIGRIHFELGNIEKAKEAFLEAEKQSVGLGLDFITGQLYSYLGELYNIENDLRKSIQFYQRSLIKFYNINNTNGLATTHKNIGKAFFDNGDVELAEKNYLLSYEFSKNMAGSAESGEIYYLMSQLYLKKNQLKLAEINIQKAINFWKTKNLIIPLHKAYLLYANIKNKKGEFVLANDYLKKYINFSDSIHKQETERKVAELSELYESEQKERKIIEQNKKLEEELSHRLLIQNEFEYSKQVNRLVIAILVISLSLLVAIFIIFRNRSKQEQLKKKQKEIELQQTLLRSQMNPHFIFNAMSVIQSYIYDEDIPNSSKFLIHFSKLMRLMLENNAKEFISLDKEMEIIDRYLVIQKMRFEDRFDFVIDAHTIKDHSRLSIPPMMVQPFIENAIEHGDLDKIENGLIRIKCEIVGDLFIFTIEDNGIGRKAAQKKRKSVKSDDHRSMAIELTKSRIALLNEKYKSKGDLRIEDLDEKAETGTRVTISTTFEINY